MSEFKSLLPPNSTPLEIALEKSFFQCIDGIDVPIRSVWNPMTCPAVLLPWLAWSFHVDAWDNDWSEAQKRSYIANALYIHQHKGTIGAMRRAMESLGYGFRITEWFDMVPQGAPYTFEIEIIVPNEGIDETTYRRVEPIIMDAKNVRSQFSKLILGGSVEGNIYCGAALLCGEESELLMDAPETVTIFQFPSATYSTVESIPENIIVVMPNGGYYQKVNGNLVELEQEFIVDGE